MDTQYIEVKLESGILFAGDTFSLRTSNGFSVETDVAKDPFSDESIDKRYKILYMELLDNPYHKVVDGEITNDAIIKCIKVNEEYTK